MKKTLMLLLLIAVVGFLGYRLLWNTKAVTRKNYHQIEIGMSEPRVRWILGRPNATVGAFRFIDGLATYESKEHPGGAAGLQTGTLEIFSAGYFLQESTDAGGGTVKISFKGQHRLWEDERGRGISVQLVNGRVRYKSYRGPLTDFPELADLDAAYEEKIEPANVTAVFQKMFTDPKGLFVCLVPDGWRVDAKRESIRPETRFVSGNATITVGVDPETFQTIEYNKRNLETRRQHGEHFQISEQMLDGKRILRYDQEEDGPYIGRRTVGFLSGGAWHEIEIHFTKRNQKEALLALFDTFLSHYKSAQPPMGHSVARVEQPVQSIATPQPLRTPAVPLPPAGSLGRPDRSQPTGVSPSRPPLLITPEDLQDLGPLEKLTVGGTTYENVRWTRVSPVEVFFFHRGGAASVPVQQLLPALKEQFNFEPTQPQ